MDALPDDDRGRLVRRGRSLITATYAHIGPEVAAPDKRYAGNNLSCSNCHLWGGTKKFGLPIFGLANQFPQYSSRQDREISVEDRVNACMTRSMNGRALPDDALEMRAIVAYIDFLSSGLPPGETLPGYGAGSMPELSRAADPDRGKAVYAQACTICHGTDGSGIRRSLPTTDLGYMVPPLWGPDSFNTGAGMARLSVAANFIHFNMPHGTDYLNPRLSVSDAWDVAAYMLAQPRPLMPGAEKDFPDLLLKPVDTPYGPYADGYSQEQHRYGPFAPIREAVDKLRQQRDHPSSR
ncbi:c-type cytochrome [Microvirga roseola]|uniref:c-type cytochrome n=1 Tax=Microvirga roseola TaxID=2883126 RepID=UPI002AC32B1F|nr:c-type cytochrome [Microvirga roseola]